LMVGAVLVFLLLISIDLFIRKPWQSDTENTQINQVPSQESLTTNEGDIDASIDDTDNITEMSTEANVVSEMPYFITNNNPYSNLYLNGEFNTNKLGLFSDKLEVEDINVLYDNLDILYEVAHGNQDKDVLKGLVDSVTLEDHYHARFNGFMNELSKREQYSVYDSIKIGDGLYNVSVLIQTPAGEGDANFVSDAILTSIIYNTVDNRLSFEELTRRMPSDFFHEDERFELHVYMVENYTKGSRLYISLKSNLNEEIEIENFPVIKADIVQPNEIQETVFFKIKETGYTLVNGATFYFAVEVPITVDLINEIEIANE